MSRYFLGIDIGGTKSHALIADETGRVLGFGRGGTGNPDDVGLDGLRRVLHAITEDALRAAGLSENQIAGAGFGVGGYDWPGQREPILNVIRSLKLRAPLELVNDAMIVMLAGVSAGWGLALIAGTGCNCWGWDKNQRIGHVTGCGYMLAEGAGGSELVYKAFQAISLAWTRRGPATQLAQAFVDATHAQDVENLLEGYTTRRIPLDAGLAPLVFQVADAGDAVAQKLVRWAGRALGDLAVGVIRQLELEAKIFEIVLAGSFYKGSPVVVEELQQTIHAIAPGATFVPLNAPPVIGGVVLGMMSAGIGSAGIAAARRRFSQDALAIMG